MTPQEAAQFGWRAESGHIQSYRHNEIGRHIHFEGGTGQFYDHGQEEISVKQALDHAMPAGQVHSHFREVPNEQTREYGRGLGM